MRIQTDHLLTLGMALTTDRKTMERRVRGVFARKKSAKGIIALSLVLVLALGIAAFTTACQPGQTSASGSNATTTNGDAKVSGGDALVSGENTNASSGNTSENNTFTKADAMSNLSQDLKLARKFVVPRVEGVMFSEHGTWEIKGNPDDAQLRTAAEQFLKIANDIFTKAYTPDDLKTTYYIDKTGFRSDVWRFDSKDGVLSGALNAKTLAFLSADCLNEPADALHPSVAEGDKLDASATSERIATILGGTATSTDWRSGYSRDDATNGWMIKRDVFFPLGDGRYCTISVFGDVNLTPTTVCVYPDEDCGDESVFWRADLEWTEDAIQLLYPQDFRKGSPGADDMPLAQAFDFYYKLIETAGRLDLANQEKPEEPNATFYVDFSGARENYWHIEGGNVSFDLTSKTGHMLNLKGNGYLGNQLGLTEIPYEKMGGKEYVDATRALFAALYGKDAVQLVGVNAVYDDHYCTIDPFMTDGSSYEVMYQDGMIAEATFLCSSDPNRWTSVPDWLEKWATTNAKTGVITVQGIESGKDRYVTNWLADWVYVNNETGEIFAMEW